jgi:hypothetical protein
MGEYFGLCKEAETVVCDIVPSFDSTTGYHVADQWQKHLDLDDLNQFVNLSYLRNIYSYSQRGVASTQFFQTFEINDAKYLLPEEIPSIQTFPPTLADKEIDNTANGAFDAVVTPFLQCQAHTHALTGSSFVMLSQKRRININETNSIAKKRKQ